MANLDRATIEGMAMLAGWGKRSRDVSYVAMAESSGDPKVVNSIGCVGLLQINQPVHVGSHPQWTRAWLQDPINNLKAGLVLYKAAGEKFDGPWLDSRDKGAGGGWGQYVKGSGTGGTGSSTGSTDATQANDSFGWDPLEGFWNYLLGKPKRGPGSDQYNQDTKDWENFLEDKVPGGAQALAIKQSADQIGRLAQIAAKGANWISDPKNWGRVVYVIGGGVLVITAVSVVAKPYLSGAVGAIPTPVTKAAKAVGKRITT